MEGLIRRFSDRMKCQFFQGLPTAAFDGFLLFSPKYDIFERRSCFPSYSWTGWRGEIKYEVAYMFTHRDLMNQWLATKTWIIWYKRSTTNDTSLVWDVARETSFPVEDKWYIGYRSRQPFQPPPCVELDSSRTDPSDDFTQDLTTRSLRGYPLLQFWTLAVYFRIDNQSKHKEHQGWRALVGSDLSACGYIILDGYSDNESFFQSDGPFEFVLLSETPGKQEYHVMLLESKDGIAERRGLGMINRDFVHLSLGPGPVWKEILLG
ncbi:hypothetical protein QBC43DRAFT_355046 [Cladorrhinum sp. PSN259]|nr:hypothetical protein QBC43DRAFT_355046 [Cladorrhinum sp. PSN259]